MEIIKVAVRTAVELILKNGDINSAAAEANIFDIAGNTAAVLGGKAHRKIQKAKFEGYKSEVYLNSEFGFPEQGFAINLGGRADGVFTDDTGAPCIDEIKSAFTPFEFIDGENMIHWGQAMCYAYMYVKNNNEGEAEEGKEKPEKIYSINAQLTYFQLETEEMKAYKKSFDFEFLEAFVKDLMEKYAVWIKMDRDWKALRNASVEKLAFPFEKYRPGQRELAASVYRTVIAEKKLFVSAPTGIGKTISTIFPAIKSMGKSNTDKIFYLTARTTTRAVAYEAISMMQEKGLRFKTVAVTAKDKICFVAGRGGARICNPENCEYAKGHFDRVNGAVMDAFENNDAITREAIEECAERRRVCPYELSLDLSVYADAVICDYNYVFDPAVYLRRFFSNNFDKNYVFLIDEAHNLVDRAREMYSAEIRKSRFSAIKKSKIIGRQHKALKKCVSDINKCLLEYKKRCVGEENSHKNYIAQKEHDENFAALLLGFRIEVERYFQINKDVAAASPPEEKEQYLELLQGYFDALAYLSALNLYDERYVTYISAEGADLTVRLFCLDPSFLIGEATKRAKSAIIFSATLSPLSYYREILGGGDEDLEQSLPSPFDPANLCLVVGANINTKYKEREHSYGEVAEYINVTAKKGGNYMAFFPSYEYMKNVYEIFAETYPETPSIIQTSGMSDEQREIFLDSFQAGESKKNKILVGFCVMGGVFSEGIDLAGDRLSGAVIVGVGLPKLSSERDVIKKYFDGKNGLGYEYGYMYPGMSKVLQAAGRVIRSETDRGIVLLLDERFNYSYYKKLFPPHWKHCKTVRNPAQLKKIINNF
ncbi:MAG: ATP-dependent DNA helicase [Oscillospiraceae bacterium]|nr:ATP-dependent DNA helicase [Oscillospiraceae bacterium]